MENMVEWWWWRVGGGTDLDTTELHQHNDQSTQSRPKPEGSGRRRAVGYKPETKSRGSECSRWNQVWHPCALMLDGNTKKNKNKTKQHHHTFILHLCQIKRWIIEEEQRQPMDRHKTDKDAVTSTQTDGRTEDTQRWTHVTSEQSQWC